MASDKRTIGLTSDDQELSDSFMLKGWFKTEVDLARFAMALAIKEGCEPGEVDGAGTKWNEGTIDPDGDLRNIIPVFYPETTTPYRLVEYLIHVGLRIMSTALEDPSNNLQYFYD